MWLRIYYGFSAVLLLVVAAFVLYIYTTDRSNWPDLVIAVGCGALGAALLWKTIVGFKDPKDLLVPPLDRF